MWSFQQEYPQTTLQTTTANTYYRRPMVPHVDSVATSALAFSNAEIPHAPPGVHRTSRTADTIGISVAVQTDFREIEVQTDPWTAPLDETACGTSNQEVRSLLELTVANGLLPAHEETMRVIERIRRMEAFDAAIPPPLDPTQSVYTAEDLLQEQRRVSMLVERDMATWRRKEAELKKAQELRLDILIQKLLEREEARTEIRLQKLERMRAAHETKTLVDFNKLDTQRVSTLKKLAASRDAKLRYMRSRIERSNYTDRVVMSLKKGPRLALPESFSTCKNVHDTIHQANSLNAPFLRPGDAPYRYTGVIRLAGTELRTQDDFDEILQFLPNEKRLTLGAPLNHSRAAQTTRLYPTQARPVALSGPLSGTYTGNMTQTGTKMKPKSVNSDGTIPTLLPPPGMTREEFTSYLNQTARRYAKRGVEASGVERDAGAEATTDTMGGSTVQKEGASSTEFGLLNTVSAPAGQEGTGKKASNALHYQDPPNIDKLRLADAALFIQNLIRGAAAQVRLYHGKERRLGLVRELRLAHELVLARNEGALLSNTSQDRIATLKSALATSAVSSAVTGIMGTTLDALAKDRLRREQTSRAQAVLEMALRERNRREYAESVQREQEAFDRAKVNFRRQQIMEAHRDMADGLLTRITKRTVDADAATRAKELAVRQVEALVELDYQNSQNYMKNPENCIRDLMASFLLPEVDRRMLVERLRADQAAIGLAVRGVTEEAATTTGK